MDWIGGPVDFGVQVYPKRLVARAGTRDFDDVDSRKLRDLGAADIGHQEVLQGFAVSPDGQWVLYGRADEYDSDIMLVSNFH